MDRMRLNHRLLPPTEIKNQTKTVNGRVYSGTPGQVFDVNFSDAAMLEASGWSFVAYSGSTADRPDGPAPEVRLSQVEHGLQYFDTTLSALIVWDGAAWRDPATGNAV